MSFRLYEIPAEFEAIDALLNSSFLEKLHLN
jgi:hypothetical protein